MRLHDYIVFYLSLVIIPCSSFVIVNQTTNYNVTIQVPEESSALEPYKSIHIQYSMPENKLPWNIVGFEPLIDQSGVAIQQISIHFCNPKVYRDSQIKVWYDDKSRCEGPQAMLVFQWTTPESFTHFQLPNDIGFLLEKSLSIVISIFYVEQQSVIKDHSGVIIYVSTRLPRFALGSITVGNHRHDVRFSCRSSIYSRVLYGVKQLSKQDDTAWWQIYVIRNRSFGRKLIQSVLDSSTNEAPKKKLDVALVSSEIFLTSGDYIIVECEKNSHSNNCHFLIYYMYRLDRSKSIEKDYQCAHDDYPDLFKLIPPRGLLKSSMPVSSSLSDLSASTIFFLIFMALIFIWMMTIVICVITRRVRGLKNFRTEPSSPFSELHTRPDFGQQGGRNRRCQQRTAAVADNIAQLDVEHMGLMS